MSITPGSPIVLQMRAVGFICLMLSGCARVIPPMQVEQPVTVYLTDYGRHSSVVLPAGAGRGVEYTYGDWKYYALNQWKWYVGASALFCSEGATLGRRDVPMQADPALMKQTLGARRIVALEVEESKVLALLGAVETRYAAALDTQVYNAYQRTHFVRDSSRYGILNTCNHATAQWLRALGCRVKGWPLLSRFRVEKPKPKLTPERCPAP